MARQTARDCNHAANVWRLESGFPVWDERERGVMADLMLRKELSPEAILRSALRIYQLVDSHQMRGMELCFRTPEGEIIRPFHSQKLSPMP